MLKNSCKNDETFLGIYTHIVIFVDHTEYVKRSLIK